MALEGCSDWPREGLRTIKALGASGLGKHHHAGSMLSPQVEALSPHLAELVLASPTVRQCVLEHAATLSVCVTCCHSSLTVPDQTGGAPAANE